MIVAGVLGNVQLLRASSGQSSKATSWVLSMIAIADGLIHWLVIKGWPAVPAEAASKLAAAAAAPPLAATAAA